jgi:hypothetical protein
MPSVALASSPLTGGRRVSIDYKRHGLSRHPEARHSPHSESSSVAVSEAVQAFLGTLV